jgi:RNA polymerase sigma-70 factor (ECF subfamily)
MKTAADPDAGQSFETHRHSLMGLAYRMLGSRAEAEDVVQDAYLRWHVRIVPRLKRRPATLGRW